MSNLVATTGLSFFAVATSIFVCTFNTQPEEDKVDINYQISLVTKTAEIGRGDPLSGEITILNNSLDDLVIKSQGSLRQYIEFTFVDVLGKNHAKSGYGNLFISRIQPDKVETIKSKTRYKGNVLPSEVIDTKNLQPGEFLLCVRFRYNNIFLKSAPVKINVK